MLDHSTEGNWTWKVTLHNVRGRVQVKLETDCPWRPKQAKVALYEGAPPADPTRYVWFNWYGPPQSPDEWNTGKIWGPGWSAALIAQDNNTSATEGNYHYVATAPLTE